jgi:quercetin dioxygenase-like cupin family protein
MKDMKKILAALLFTAGAATALAQTPGIKREVLQKADLSVPAHEGIMARSEVAGGGTVARHTHAGEEFGYVLEGECDFLIEGEAPRKLKTGDSFVVPAGKVHSAKNTGSGPLKLISVYIVEKGKPLATPAP